MWLRCFSSAAPHLASSELTGVATISDTEQFVASLVGPLAWPVAVLTIVLLFRRQIGGMLKNSIRRLRAGPIEFEFDRVLSSASADLGLESKAPVTGPQEFSTLNDLTSVAQASPSAAILEAHSRVEYELRELTKSVADRRETSRGAVALARVARAHGLITPETENAVAGVTALRNLVAHGRQSDVSRERAIDYLALVDGVIFALRQKR